MDTTTELYGTGNEIDFDRCFSQPKRECLSQLFLPQNTVDEIFETHDDDEFVCLYFDWLETADALGKMDILNNKTKVAAMLSESCPPSFDGENCWHGIQSGTSLSFNCPDFVDLMTSNKTVSRTCIDGAWNKTNYVNCLTAAGWNNFTEACREGRTDVFGINCDEYGVTTEALTPQELFVEQLSLIQRDIYFFGGCFSLLFLTIALLIFCVFKSLQCPRVHIHKNLVISLMLQCIINIVIFEPYVMLKSSTSGDDIKKEAQRTTYIEHVWLCKALFTLSNYVSMTNVFWALVEGLFLITRISIAVFSNSTPYFLFYFIGWGIPAIFTIAWALCVHYRDTTQSCWRNSLETDYFLLITVPTLIAVLINVIFLICIIRILVTKLHAVNTDEHVQVRKAMKATVVLLPLLSITSILFIWAPGVESSPNVYFAYRITNASLQVAQGIFVSVLFCYFNGEVRSALIKLWKQWRSETFRYRSSRASSVCVTQSEAILWTCSPLPMRSYESTKCGTRASQHLAISSGNQSRRMSHISHVSSATETAGTPV